MDLGPLTKTEKEKRTEAQLTRILTYILIVRHAWNIYKFLVCLCSGSQENTSTSQGVRGSKEPKIYGQASYLFSILERPLSKVAASRPCLPRCYPAGFGENLRKAWEAHMATCHRRDLRFKPQLENNLTPIEQFDKLPLNDLWEDAKLHEPLAYMFQSKKLRWGVISFVIPQPSRGYAWQDP